MSLTELLLDLLPLAAPLCRDLAETFRFRLWAPLEVVGEVVLIFADLAVEVVILGTDLAEDAVEFMEALDGPVCLDLEPVLEPAFVLASAFDLLIAVFVASGSGGGSCGGEAGLRAFGDGGDEEEEVAGTASV